VDPRAGLDDVEKRKFLTPQGLELRPLRRPAHRQSLYRLRYPGSQVHTVPTEIKITKRLKDKATVEVQYIIGLEELRVHVFILLG
jgi:hypothetical protein